MINTNRLDLFKRLTIDELDETIKTDVFESLLDTNYDDFVNFYSYIQIVKDDVSNVSAFISDGNIYYEITYKDGTKKRYANE